MIDYNANGYTGRFLIDTTNGAVALPILNNSFVRTVSGGTDFGTGEKDALQEHQHYYLNWNGSGFSGPGNGASDGNTLTTVNNTGRTADETRPKNVRFCPYMQIANTITELDTVDINAALSAYNSLAAATSGETGDFTLAAVNNRAVTPLSLAGGFKYGTNQSLSSNGYQKLPGGLIIQWGLCTTAGTRVYVSFPLTFSNAVFSITLGAEDTNGTGGESTAAGVDYDSSGTPPSVNGFYIGKTTSQVCYWMAIGY
jgi:hypothetical protein